MVGAGRAQTLRGRPDCTQHLDLMAPLALLALGQQPECPCDAIPELRPGTLRRIGPQNGLLLADWSCWSALAALRGPCLVHVASVTTPL